MRIDQDRLVLVAGVADQSACVVLGLRDVLVGGLLREREGVDRLDARLGVLGRHSRRRSLEPDLLVAEVVAQPVDLGPELGLLGVGPGELVGDPDHEPVDLRLLVATSAHRTALERGSTDHAGREPPRTASSPAGVLLDTAHG
jgi:hypothetical protein